MERDGQESARTDGTASLADLSENDFERLATHLRRLTGIHLPYSSKNVSLMSGRIAKLARRHSGQLDATAIANGLDHGDEAITTAFVNTLTTNTTSFFREPDHFAILVDEIPKILTRRVRGQPADLRVWCAAASTGQEPYTIAIVLKEVLGDSQAQVKFLATDIDSDVLRAAKAGTYRKEEMVGLSPAQIKSFFEQVSDVPPLYRAGSDIKALIRFARVNLLDLPYPFEHAFDVVFCRNVFIYFEPETVSTIVSEIVRHLRVGGILLVGHSETLIRPPRGLERIGPAVFRKTA